VSAAPAALLLGTPKAVLAGTGRRTLRVTARLGRAATLTLTLLDGRARALGRWRRSVKPGTARPALPVSARVRQPRRAALVLASDGTRRTVAVAIASGRS
jgi:hypothetical protein